MEISVYIFKGPFKGQKLNNTVNRVTHLVETNRWELLTLVLNIIRAGTFSKVC